MTSTIASTATPSQHTVTTSMAQEAFPIAQTQLNEQFELKSCSPQSLVDMMIAVRGETETSRILQEALALIDAHTVGNTKNNATVVSPDDKRSLSNSVVDTDKKDGASNNQEKLLGKPLLSEPIETSFLSPRMGKFSIQLHGNGLSATKMNDSAVKFVLLKTDDDASSISHVLLFPKPEDCKAIVYNRKLNSDSKPKKVGGNLVVLRLESPVQLPKQKSPTQLLCFALPADKKRGRPTGPSLAKEENISVNPTESWGELIHRALGGRFAQVLGNGGDGKNNHAFKSYQPPNTSTTTAGMPFVSCYLGVNDGVLYPLEEGLLFYKPPRFLPRSDLHSIACGRGGGGDSSRYVDMGVQCSNSNDDQMENVEFTNIQREENSVMNSYIHDILIPAMTRDANERKTGAEEDGDEDSDEVVVEAIAEEVIYDDATEDGDDGSVEEVRGDYSDDSDSGDEDFEDAESEDSGSEGHDSSVDEIDYGEDDEGIAVVRDEFAQELVDEKQRKNNEESATESEDEESSSGRRRASKRLRR